MSTKEIDELIYSVFPRKVGKYAALKAIEKAAQRISKEAGIPLIEARRCLYKATKAYAASPAGNNPDRSKIPHPSTFFNQGRYEDDPREWQIVTGEQNVKPKSGYDKYMETLRAGEGTEKAGSPSRY